ncbi:MAG: hypothetical protein E7359_00050 [Clostridiales bacterium]|nr:hypothetical protein [Clostridiales bacterium]
MKTLNKIREDLKDIRYYYSRKEIFEKVSDSVGENTILEKIDLYNNAIRSASPRLYDLYVSLYLGNQTQESLADRLGYTIEYISRLNSQLVKFLYTKLSKGDN